MIHTKLSLSSVFITLIFLFNSPFGFSQSPLVSKKSHNNVLFRNINIQSGLSTLFIEHMHQDKYGFVWIATQYGLHFFDGSHLELFKNENSDPYSICSDFVNKIFEDSKGEIWLCTTRGLSNFKRNNETFISYYPDSVNINSQNNHILSLEEDSKGIFWVFTPRGLFSFDKSTGEFKSFEKDSVILDARYLIFSKFVRRICEDKDSNVWITGSFGLRKFVRKSKQMVHYRHKPDDVKGISSDLILDIIRDKNGHIWFTTSDGGLNRIATAPNGNRSDKNTEFYKYRTSDGSGIISDQLASLYIDKGHNLWITGNKGVSRYNDQMDHFESFITGDELVYRMLENTLGGFWIRSKTKFLNLSVATGEIIEYQNNPDIQHMTWGNFFVDRNGMVWTQFEGYGIQIAYSWQNKLRHYSNRTGFLQFLPDNKINAILFDYDNSLWLGTYQGLVNIQTHNFNLSYDYKIFRNSKTDNKSLPSSYILSMCLTRESELWIGTANGLARYNRQSGNFTNYLPDHSVPNSLRHKYVQDIIEDSRGILWVLTQDGPDLLDKTSGNFYQLAHQDLIGSGSIGNFYVVIEEDTNGTIWLGDFEKGLVQLIFPDTFSVKNYIKIIQSGNYLVNNYQNNPREPGSLSSNSVTCIYEDSYKRLWIGTGKGLNLYLPGIGKFISINESDGLLNEIICGIRDDKHGNIWVSTKKGISRIKFSEKADLQSIKSTLEISNFNLSYGLQGLEFSEKSSAMAKNGELLFGGFNGFNIFHPDSIQANEVFPELYINRFFIHHQRTFFDKPVQDMEQIVLKHNENVFSIEYIALEFANPDQIKYKYKLENFDKDWIFGGSQTIANYTNIPPGKYTFRVKVSNETGTWGEDEKSINIIVKKPIWATWAAYFLYLAVFVLVLYRYKKFLEKRESEKSDIRIKKLEIEKMKELDEHKSEFFANISHEFRTPLSLIIGTLENLKKNEQLNSEFNTEIDLLEKNSSRLYRLVNQLLELSKLDEGKMKCKLSFGSISASLKYIFSAYSSLSERKKIKYSIENHPTEITGYWDQDKLEMIIHNLLSNAFKFTPEYGKVHVKYELVQGKNIIPDLSEIKIIPGSSENTYLFVSVNDNGPGIASENMGRIFNRFEKVIGNSIAYREGMGIGLALTKELIDFLGGYLQVQSVVGKGSNFSVYIPVNRNAFDHAEIEEIHDISVDSDSEKFVTGISDNHIHEESIDNQMIDNGFLPSVLIVEDSNEMRTYLQQSLKKEYVIKLAIDGVQGWEMALNIIPDLIVTDLMMPVRDGLSLCKMLREDERTSHIPIIILTAKASLEHRIEGLKAGADDYLEKPFKIDELRARINNLVNQRQKLKEKYCNILGFGTSNSDTSDIDEEFLKRAVKQVEQNISNENWSIPEFSDTMNMSRSQLFRKIKALTGLSVTDFILSIKLKQAAHLLENNAGSITEVAFRVGFNDSSYFAKCFKKKFSVSPRAYALRYKNS